MASRAERERKRREAIERKREEERRAAISAGAREPNGKPSRARRDRDEGATPETLWRLGKISTFKLAEKRLGDRLTGLSLEARTEMVSQYAYDLDAADREPIGPSCLIVRMFEQGHFHDPWAPDQDEHQRESQARDRMEAIRRYERLCAKAGFLGRSKPGVIAELVGGSAAVLETDERKRAFAVIRDQVWPLLDAVHIRHLGRLVRQQAMPGPSERHCREGADRLIKGLIAPQYGES